MDTSKCAFRRNTHKRRERKKRLRKILQTFSSEAFHLSPMPSLSQMVIGPNLLAMGGLGMPHKPVKLKIKQKDKHGTDKQRKLFDLYEEPNFMQEFMDAEYFLAHCDMLRARKEEVRKRKDYLEKEKEAIVQELRKTTHQLYDAVNLELDCKKVLTIGKKSLEEANKIYDEIEDHAFKLFGSKAFRSPKDQVSSELLQDELRNIFSANMPPD